MISNIKTLPLRNIDVALARAFVATAETGSMTAAANLLNLTQGAVSQQVKRLEELLGKDLFKRDHRRLTLTSAGERLLLHARRLIALNDEIWGLMSAPDFEGTIRFGVPRDIIRPYIPPILRGFSDAWPKVRIQMICKSSPKLREALNGGEIDLCLTTESDTAQGGERLLTDDLVWIGGRGGSAHRETPVPIAITDGGCTFRAAMLRALEAEDRDWRMVGPLGNNDAMLATVEADIAISSVLKNTVPSHLHILGPESGLPAMTPFHVNLFVRTSQKDDVVAEFADHVRHQFTHRFMAPSSTLTRQAG